jgi:monolysocardiolipin acyltransferase
MRINIVYSILSYLLFTILQVNAFSFIPSKFIRKSSTWLPLDSSNTRYFTDKRTLTHVSSNIIINKLFAAALAMPASLNRCDEYAAHLRKGKRWGGPIIGPIVRYLNNFIVGFLFTIILRVFNRFETIRYNFLHFLVFYRSSEKGLLTISNHQSIQDDPGLWAALLPWWFLRTDVFRWVLCTEDVFFYRPWLQSILAAGNVMPLDRSGSLEQPLFQVFKEKLESGAWCHIFPEGRIWQSWRFDKDEPHLGPFKVGVGKLIAHSKVTPVVLPLYHTGMDDVVPEKQLADKKSKKPAKPQSIFPRRGKKIRVVVGMPIDFEEKIEKFRATHPGVLENWTSTSESLALYAEITNELRTAMLGIEKEARSQVENSSSLAPNN